jgi:hypothetical protein
LKFTNHLILLSFPLPIIIFFFINQYMVMGAGAPKNNFQDAGNFQPGASLAIGTKLSHRLKWPVTSKTPGILSPSAQKIRRVTRGTFISPLQNKRENVSYKT